MANRLPSQHSQRSSDLLGIKREEKGGRKAHAHSFAIMQRKKITAFPSYFTNNTNLKVLQKERGKCNKTKNKFKSISTTHCFIILSSRQKEL